MTAIAHDRAIELPVNIPASESQIEADWSVPLRPRGTIIVATGSGNGRLLKRNRQLARHLYDDGFAVLLLDLLNAEEEIENDLTGAFRLDVKLLTDRMLAAIGWVTESEVGHLPVGILGTGTASAAALAAAARESDTIKAVVSRAGRPDLAGIELHRVLTPTLLIVGNNDTLTYELNRWALRRLNGVKRLVVIPGEAEAFEDSKSFEAMCRFARRWFETHMPMPVRIEHTFETGWGIGRANLITT